MLKRLIAAGLSLGHVVLLSGATALHRHGPEPVGLRLVDLPAQYHHHDFGFTGGDRKPTPAHDECIGCRLERSPSLPSPAKAGLHAEPSLSTHIPTAVADLATIRPPTLFPRAPPRT